MWFCAPFVFKVCPWLVSTSSQLLYKAIATPTLRVSALTQKLKRKVVLDKQKRLTKILQNKEKRQLLRSLERLTLHNTWTEPRSHLLQTCRWDSQITHNRFSDIIFVVNHTAVIRWGNKKGNMTAPSVNNITD